MRDAGMSMNTTIDGTETGPKITEIAKSYSQSVR
jgi:hypothetical protein